MEDTSVIFKKPRKVNCHPLGENSPNLVTLLPGHKEKLVTIKLRVRILTPSLL
jgi:hypothetical protein